jgi:glycosyltransferase involved in cell wall biosynthesis
MTLLISIIIPAFNEEKLIQHTLERIQFALNEQKESGISWEIIVCDNNSTDNTAKMAAQMGTAVTFEPINQISRARNSGAKAARGDWFLFIDADSYPTPELITEVIAVCKDTAYLGCGTTVLVEDGTLFNKLRIERLNPLFRLFNISGGAFLMCERAAFSAVQGFTTSLFALEEIDFVIRLKRYGRSRSKKFTVLHRHPVITSGRKGEYNLFSLASLFSSDFIAVILFGLHYLLPKRYMQKLGSRLLGFWYHTRR